ncbi:MAG TPA: flagellar biosynthesis protein FlhB [Candidatus Gastranaerophilaceae bacterium]|nr:flagellar biosynthesis protein FlhB [Candidatus Gastranaerophilaceae bacterium]HPT41029.1 flagellar biosynthesis protein FlhB [Candidatus Gastranaerophilaceae bacterium]
MGNQAAERTEKATGRRRGKERDKGNISKSQDLISALMITMGVALLSIFSGYVLSNLKNLFYYTFTHLNPKDISTDDILLVFLPFAKTAGQIILPFLLFLMVMGTIVIRLQIGHVFAKEKIKLKLSNISPMKMLQNAKKLFNPVEPRTIVEFVKSLIKLAVVGMCGFSVINGRKDELFGLLGMDIEPAFAIIGSILGQMVVNICLAMLVLGLLDKKYQDYEYEKSIKMTKQEVKDEMKDTEGDPKIKAKIRSIQVKMARQRMFANIPKADVVVTNPTHYAVALKYDKMESPAPRVIAKGVDYVAFRIREIAQENNIPIVENKPLAQALYKLVPLDGVIPADMFVAVAEILAYVYNKDKN